MPAKEATDKHYTDEPVPKFEDESSSLHHLLRFNPPAEMLDRNIDSGLVNYQVYKRFRRGGLKPANPTLVTAKPTGPFEYAVSKDAGQKYLFLFEAEIIDVVLDDGTRIHLDVTFRRAALPTAVKNRIPEHLIQFLGVHVCHPKLQHINHLLDIEEVELQWKALGFETHRCHRQVNKMAHGGVSKNAGELAIIWHTLLPPPGLNIFGCL
jgi:hypothetical protein